MPFADPIAVKYLDENPNITAKELFARGFASSYRTARRWKQYWKEGKVDHGLQSFDAPALSRRTLLRAAVFDLETTSFTTEGYSGYIICCCVLPLDTDEVTTLKIQYDEHGNDRRLVKEIAEYLAQFDFLIGHNITTYDQAFLNSRLMFHRQRDIRKRGSSDMPMSMRTTWLFDTYQVLRSMNLLTRKSLGNLIDYFGIEGEKTAIQRTSWNDVRSYDEDEFNASMDEIIYHCSQDVIANRNLFDLIYPTALGLGTNPFKLSKFRNMLE